MQSQAWTTAFEFCFTAGMQRDITQAGKFLKDNTLVFRINPNAGVSNNDFDEPWQLASIQANFSTIRGVLDCVGQHIAETLKQALWVAKGHLGASRKIENF